MASQRKSSPTNPRASIGRWAGLCLIILAFYILIRLFQDPISHEIRYANHRTQSQSVLTPTNTEFALTIDKIGASAQIIQSVDPNNSQQYQYALRDGVAHARGTSLPGHGGNIFLFAHSSADLLTAERYNSVFYLMHHLEEGDQIKVWYKGQQYDYYVTEKQVVSPRDTQYLGNTYTDETLTLMTCWPPGTTFKRLIILARPRSSLNFP